MVEEKAVVRRQLNRAKQIAEFILEGGVLVEDVLKEFRICKLTYLRDMRLLASFGYGEELKKNQLLYLRTRIALDNEIKRRLKEKRE